MRTAQCGLIWRFSSWPSAESRKMGSAILFIHLITICREWGGSEGTRKRSSSSSSSSRRRRRRKDTRLLWKAHRLGGTDGGEGGATLNV